MGQASSLPAICWTNAAIERPEPGPLDACECFCERKAIGGRNELGDVGRRSGLFGIVLWQAFKKEWQGDLQDACNLL